MASQPISSESTIAGAGIGTRGVSTCGIDVAGIGVTLIEICTKRMSDYYSG